MNNAIAKKESLRSRILKVLKEQPEKHPYLDVIELFDLPAIRELSNDRNEVSVMLSDMARSGRKLLSRIPKVRPGTNVRYAYALRELVEPGKGTAPAEEPKVPQVTVTPKKTKEKAKPSITVTDKRVTIETESIRIVIEI